MARSNEAIEVIQLLCLEAGRLVEDASVELALVIPREADERRTHLERLLQATADAADLLAAADVLGRRGFDEVG